MLAGIIRHQQALLKDSELLLLSSDKVMLNRQAIMIHSRGASSSKFMTFHGLDGEVAMSSERSSAQRLHRRFDPGELPPQTSEVGRVPLVERALLNYSSCCVFRLCSAGAAVEMRLDLLERCWNIERANETHLYRLLH